MYRRGFLGWALCGAMASSVLPRVNLAAQPGARTLRISTHGDLLEFSTQQLDCTAGAPVRVEFTNAARYVDFEHNWVLIRPGTFDAVVAAAEKAGEARGWLPANDPAILAATKMAHRGETVSVSFEAPPPGKYVYLCTMPGHAASMWGVFNVTAS